MDYDVITTRVSKIWLDDDNVIHVIVLPESNINFEDVKAVFEVIRTLSGEEKHPLFFDIRNIKSITREARAFSASEDSAGIVSATAALVNSTVSKVIGNFVLIVDKPLYPTRIFTAEPKAMDWLKEKKYTAP